MKFNIENQLIYLSIVFLLFQLYLQGPSQWKLLKSQCVSIPFDCLQTTSVLHWININFFETKKERIKVAIICSLKLNSISHLNSTPNLIPILLRFCSHSHFQYEDYTQYVLLPETLIRIFAKVCDISFEAAETEMNNGFI